MDIRRSIKYISYMTLIIYPVLILLFKLAGYPLQKWTGLTLVILGSVLLCQSKVRDVIIMSFATIPFFAYVKIASAVLFNGSDQYLIYDYNAKAFAKILSLIDITDISEAVTILPSKDLSDCFLGVVVLMSTVLMGLLIRGLKHFRKDWIWISASFVFLVVGWFLYVDVRELLIYLLLGAMIMWSEKVKLTYLWMLICVVLVGSVLISWVLPYEFTNHKLQNIAPNILILRSDYEKNNNSYFDFEKSMYYPNGDRLGGSVERDSNKLLMEVKTASKLVYLRGRVKRTYTGDAWLESQSSYEKFSSASRYNEKIREEKDAKSVYISYEDLRSLTVFSPLGVLENSLSTDKLRENSDQMFFYKEGIFEDDVEGYRIIYTNYEDFIDDENSYLEIPDIVTDRTRDLASSLVEKGDSDYEKTIKIRDYLRSSFPYSLTVSEEVTDGDFVDNFLFVEGKGYCTYFSSALAIMLRLEGIPTRYVEGYIVDQSSFDGEKYLIYEDKAHAWVEAYIDGKGWITVDATPIYSYDEEDAEKKVTFDALTFEEDTKSEEEEAVTEAKHDEVKGYSEKEGFSLYMLSPILIIPLILIYFKKRRISPTRQNALKLIYMIDGRISALLKGQISENSTPYEKMRIFSEVYEDAFVRVGFSGDSNSGIIKITERILYSKQEVDRHIIDSLEQFYHVVKKMKT